ncbi:MAG: response regulator, partial [Alphaproteobacteria bacterium]
RSRNPGSTTGNDRVAAVARRVAATPIIMLTSVDQPGNGRLFSDLQINGHLVKPARSAVLMETIATALHDTIGRDPAASENPAPAVSKTPAPPVSKTNDNNAGTGQSASSSGSVDENATPEQNPTGQAGKDSPTADTPNNTNKAGAPKTADLRLQAKSGEPVTILVAEDNDVNQIVIEQILATTGHSFLIVDNGQLAVEKAAQLTPQLILMDVSMPQMNGLEATAQIRKLEAGTDSHTPIIGLTAHALKGDREMCLDAGMDDYMPKPISPDRLTELIDRYLAADEFEEAKSA